MKQMFPILIAIIATTLIMVMYMNKEGRQWSKLEKAEQRQRLAWLTVFGVIVFVICVLIFLLA